MLRDNVSRRLCRPVMNKSLSDFFEGSGDSDMYSNDAC